MANLNARACHQLKIYFRISYTKYISRTLRVATMTRRHALRDDQWERIKDLLPVNKVTLE